MTSTRETTNNKIIKEAHDVFFKNTQSTHNHTVSASMGVVLAKLSRKYLIPQDLKNTQAVETIKKVRQIKAIAAFTDLMKEKGRLVEGSDLAQAITYIEGVMTKPLDQFDRVIFWERNEKGILEKHDIFISIKETFAIVCAALMNESVYHYESDEQRKKAKIERLDVLCACLINLSKHKACHTDTRHELARCLNHNYPGVNFITVDYDFILQHMQQEIAARLFPKDDWQSTFKTIVWPWIREGEMPKEAWACLNPSPSVSACSSSESETTSVSSFTAQLKTSAEAAFLSHGLILDDETTDKKRTIREAIDLCVQDQRIMEIDHPAIKDPVIIRLYNFIKSLGVNERQKPEVAVFIQWLNSGFDANNQDHIVRMNHYFIIFNIAKKITRYSYALKNEGHGQLLTELQSMIECYYREGLVASSDLLAKIEAFNAAYSKYHQDKKPRWIEDFFAIWFANQNSSQDATQERSHLFYRLCKPEYLASIRISDLEITSIFKDYQQRSDANQNGNEVIIIDLYFLNRCLLHALTVPVEEWSAIFKNALIQLYRFIVNNFNTPDMRGMEGQLKRDSYPDRLLLQIKYLLDCYEFPRIVRPKQVVLTPALIESYNESQLGFSFIINASVHEVDPSQIIAAFNSVKGNLTFKQFDDILTRQANDDKRMQILQLVTKVPSLDISNIIEVLNKFSTDMERLKALRVIKSKVPNLFHAKLSSILSGFETGDYRSRELNSEALHEFCKNLCNILSGFETDAHRLQVFNVFDLSAFQLPATYVSFILATFTSDEQRLVALNTLAIPELAIVGTFTILSKFTDDSVRLHALNALKNKVTRVNLEGGEDEYFVGWLASNFDPDNQKNITKLNNFVIVHRMSSMLHPNYEKLPKLLADCRRDDYDVSVLEFVSAEYIFNIFDFIHVLINMLSDSLRLKVLSELKDKVPQLNGENLSKVLKEFKAGDKQLQALNILIDKVTDLSSNDLIIVSSSIVPVQRIEALRVLIGKVTSFNAEDLNTIHSSDFTDDNQRLQVLNVLQVKVDHIPVVMLPYILSCYSEDEQRVQALEIIIDKVPVLTEPQMISIFVLFTEKNSRAQAETVINESFRKRNISLPVAETSVDDDEVLPEGAHLTTFSMFVAGEHIVTQVVAYDQVRRATDQVEGPLNVRKRKDPN